MDPQMKSFYCALLAISALFIITVGLMIYGAIVSNFTVIWMSICLFVCWLIFTIIAVSRRKTSYAQLPNV